MPIKRDNWTNDEVMHLIKGRIPELLGSIYPEDRFLAGYIEGIKSIVAHFEDFKCPENSPSALALETSTGDVVHVGRVLPQ